MKCPYCATHNQHERYNHWLGFETVEALRDHVTDWMQFESCTPERKRERIAGIVMSYREARANWSSGDGSDLSELVDAHTGARLHWRDAREQVFQLERDKRQAVHDAQATARPSVQESDTASVAEGLAHSLKRMAPKDLWAAAHVLMLEQNLGAPGRWHEAAAFCREMMVADPGNARDWETEAAWWEDQVGGLEPQRTPGGVNDADLPF